MWASWFFGCDLKFFLPSSSRSTNDKQQHTSHITHWHHTQTLTSHSLTSYSLRLGGLQGGWCTLWHHTGWHHIDWHHTDWRRIDWHHTALTSHRLTSTRLTSHRLTSHIFFALFRLSLGKLLTCGVIRSYNFFGCVVLGGQTWGAAAKRRRQAGGAKPEDANRLGSHCCMLPGRKPRVLSSDYKNKKKPFAMTGFVEYCGWIGHFRHASFCQHIAVGFAKLERISWYNVCCVWWLWCPFMPIRHDQTSAVGEPGHSEARTAWAASVSWWEAVTECGAPRGFRASLAAAQL